MPEWLLEFSTPTAGAVSAALAIIMALLYAARWHAQIEKKIGDMMKVSGMAACLPAGAFLMLSAFKPEMTDNLRDFPVPTALMGTIYTVYLAIQIIRIYVGPRKNIAVCSHCGEHLVAIAVCSHCKAPIPEERK